MDLELAFEIDAENPNLGDLKLVNGQLSWLGETPSEDQYRSLTRQRCYCDLLLFLGEWYQDQTQGVPWRQYLLGSNVSRERASSVLRRALEAVPGVAEVTQLDVEIDGKLRVANASFTVLSELGQSVTVDQLDAPFRPFGDEVIL